MADTDESKNERESIAVYEALLEIHRRMTSVEFHCDRTALAAELRKVADAVPRRDMEKERAEQEARDAADDGTVPDGIETPWSDSAREEEALRGVIDEIHAVEALEASLQERRQWLHEVATAIAELTNCLN